MTIYNFFSYLLQTAIAKGVPQDLIVLILLLPVIATCLLYTSPSPRD